MVTYDKKQSSSSSSSSEEETQNNHKRENGDSSGVGRSYECVYCKRGFNTAQALGGHMNIHRKDRAKKNKPSASSKPIDTNPNLYLSCNNLPDSGHNNNRDHLQLGLMSYGKYFPESLISTSSDEYLCTGEVHYSYDDHNNQKYCTKDYLDGDYHQGPINPSMGSFDWMRRSSSEYYSPVAVEDLLEMNNKQVIDRDEDLDLELRLGHYRS